MHSHEKVEIERITELLISPKKEFIFTQNKRGNKTHRKSGLESQVILFAVTGSATYVKRMWEAAEMKTHGRTIGETRRSQPSDASKGKGGL